MMTTPHQIGTSLRTVSRLTLALDPIRDTQAIFKTTLRAFSWPGSVQQLPVNADGAPANPWLAGLLITLLDHETTLAVEPFPGAEDLEHFVRQRTSASSADVGGSDFVVAEATAVNPELSLRVKHGTLAYPDDGATIVVSTPSLDQSAIGGLRLGLDGPGVPGGRQVRVHGLPAVFLAFRADAVRHYPCGTDIVLVDDAGRMVVLPRSTRITVLEEGS